MSPYKTFKPHENNENQKIWEILLKKGIISEDILKKALELQNTYKQKNIELKIWEILAMIWENRTQIVKELNKYGVSLRIGEIMLFRGLITEEQFKEIRANLTKLKKENPNNKISFGEVALNLWYVEEKEFYHFLKEVWIPLKTWEKLIEAGVVTRKMVNFILSSEKYEGIRTLDALLKEGIITIQQYDNFKSQMRHQDTIIYSTDHLELFPNNNWNIGGKIR